MWYEEEIQIGLGWWQVLFPKRVCILNISQEDKKNFRETFSKQVWEW